MNSSTSKQFIITDIASDGRGVGKDSEGRVVMIKGGLPGDEVAASVSPVSGKGIANGVVDEIITPSPERVEHPCPHHIQGCPASPLGAFRIDAALEWKHSHLKETLRRIGGLEEPDVRPPVPSPKSWGYRDRLELRLFPSREGFALGYKSPGGMIPVGDCLLGRDEIRRGVRELNASLAGEQSLGAGCAPRSVPRLLFRYDGRGGAVALAFIENVRALDISRLGRILNRVNFSGWQIRLVKDMDSRLFKFQTAESSGDARVFINVGIGRDIFVDPAVFSQTNLEGGKLLREMVTDLLPQEGRMMDLYGGFGAFALEYALKKSGRAVVIEASGAAVKTGQSYADNNGLPVNYVKANLAGRFPRLKYAGRFDAAVIDPPRKGIHRSLLDFLDVEGPSSLIYISCHPAALARDMKRFKHYMPLYFIPIDLFPNTPEIEVIAVLRRR